MKIYRLEKGITLVGKTWEIKEKLKEYSRLYHTVNDLLHDEKIKKTIRRGITRGD